jgi:hypothetical protein
MTDAKLMRGRKVNAVVAPLSKLSHTPVSPSRIFVAESVR